MSVSSGRFAIWSAVVLLTAVVLVFAVIRVSTDLPLIVLGLPAATGSFEERYVGRPWPAYLHIVPGVLYLVGAPFQLSRGFRRRHLRLHRRMGRAVLSLGMVSGVFALAFGIPFSYGGFWQSAATAVFGAYFLVALVLAYRAVRSRRIAAHRRWMIRAFAVGLGVGTIRLWIGVFVGAGGMTLQDAFAPAFWLGLGLHALAAELWLRRRPAAPAVR
ncbi:DUF2306 domain-containing protein [Kocuria sp. NPDC057446]|uniref:DUF2306 domain-containing protein n=1 Tax=Kocuria sp. NPDC057446 TaxID=3346137 RepID=UPI0036C979F8